MRYDLVLIDGRPEIFYFEKTAYPLIRSLTEDAVTGGTVTVEEEAFDELTKHGRVSQSQIVVADEDITRGDRIAVQSTASGEFIAVGEAMVNGGAMDGSDGYAVSTVQFAGDPLSKAADLFSG